ncbi:MAG: hypothetical protein JXR60_06835 [Bacteroidales bacterium]|nr:hypothetical protein [Bacteroidales bacterium]
MKSYRSYMLLSISLTVLGILFSTLNFGMKSFGIVFVAVGGVFLIIGFKKKEEQQSK